jgi:hypothetical protein
MSKPLPARRHCGLWQPLDSSFPQHGTIDFTSVVKYVVQKCVGSEHAEHILTANVESLSTIAVTTQATI